MAWGVFSSRGIGPIVRTQERMDQIKYKNILENVMESYAFELMPIKYIFHYDNDRKHTSRLVKGWLEEQKSTF